MKLRKESNHINHGCSVAVVTIHPNFSRCLRGSSLPGLCTLGTSLCPPSPPAGIICRSCLKSHPQTSPQTTQKSYPKDNFSKCQPFAPKYSYCGGKGGGPDLFLLSRILIFCYLGAYARFQNPKTNTSGRMSKEPKRKKERQISPNIPILTAKFSNILNIWTLNMQVKQIMVPVNLLTIY